MICSDNTEGRFNELLSTALTNDIMGFGDPVAPEMRLEIVLVAFEVPSMRFEDRMASIVWVPGRNGDGVDERF